MLKDKPMGNYYIIGIGLEGASLIMLEVIILLVTMVIILVTLLTKDNKDCR